MIEPFTSLWRSITNRKIPANIQNFMHDLYEIALENVNKTCHTDDMDELEESFKLDTQAVIYILLIINILQEPVTIDT